MLLLLLAWQAAAAAGAAAQRTAVEGIIRGRVIDDVTGQGLAAAVVELLDGRERVQRSVIADDSGHFVLRRVRPGAFWLRASRIGYARTLTPPWRVESGEALIVEIRMDQQAVVLAPLEVTARSFTHEPVLSAFRERARRRLGGHIISRAEIERQKPARVTDLLAAVPGVMVVAAGGMATSRTVQIGRALPGAGPCPVQIYLDGVLASRGQQTVSPDDLVVPEGVEGIEIYRGLSTVPAEFLTPEARCGVIAIWTRRGG